MPRLTKEERQEAYKLFENGLNQTEIAKRMKTNRSTINRLIKRTTENGSTDDRQRPGRPRVMPADKDTWLECSGMERPFVCRECGKTFKTFSNLKGHMKIHSDTPLFHCDQCGRGFIILSGLQRHMRCHTGEKPYICEYCARGFADISTMKTHIRSHTGERPFKCHLCGHACATAGNLHHHMKVHRDKDGMVPRPINVKPSKANATPIFDCYKNSLRDIKCESDPNRNGRWGAKKRRKSSAMEKLESDVDVTGDGAEVGDVDGGTAFSRVKDRVRDERNQLETVEVTDGDPLESSSESVNGFMVVLPSIDENDSEDVRGIKHESGECHPGPSPESSDVSNLPQTVSCESYTDMMDVKKEVT